MTVTQYIHVAQARTRTSLNAEVTPKRYAPWLAKAASVVVLLDALTGTAKRLNLDSFVLLSNLTVEGEKWILAVRRRD